MTGRYFADCNEALPSPAANSNHEAARLWHISDAMIKGIPLFFPVPPPNEEETDDPT